MKLYKIIQYVINNDKSHKDFDSFSLYLQTFFSCFQDIAASYKYLVFISTWYIHKLCLPTYIQYPTVRSKHW